MCREADERAVAYSPSANKSDQPSMDVERELYLLLFQEEVPESCTDEMGPMSEDVKTEADLTKAA